MSYPDKLRTSWQLMQTSFRVIRTNPKLALFPVLSTLCAVGLALFFLAPLIVFLVAGLATESAHGTGVDWSAVGWRLQRIGWFYWVAVYLASMFAATFFNVACYHEIMGALAGEEVSIGHGLKFAAGRWRAIAMWSLLAGTVGILIRMIEERLGWLGKLVMAGVGMVWSVAAVFAIPVIIRREDNNPIAVLRDSAATLKRTWGESLTGFVGLKVAGAAVILGAMIGAVVSGVVLGALFHVWAGIAIGVLWLLEIFAVSFLLSLATHVYRCALYVYASEGVVPEPYTAEMMNAAWKVRKVKG